jgi:hypothetical protein
VTSPTSDVLILDQPLVITNQPVLPVDLPGALVGELPIEYWRRETQTAAADFNIEFNLHNLEYWYYTLTEDGSGPRYLADSLITVEAPVIANGRWTGEWESVQMTLADAYRHELRPTGWYDRADFDWLDSPLDALQYPLPATFSVDDYLADFDALLIPEPATLTLLFAAPILVLKRRRRA